VKMLRILGELIAEGQRKGVIANQGERISNVPDKNISTIDGITKVFLRSLQTKRPPVETGDLANKFERSKVVIFQS
jgi:hypothetical protein